MIDETKDNERTKIALAIQAIDPTTLDIWADLDALSTHTRVEDVEVDPDGIVMKSDGTFSGVSNLYVTLQYGSDSDEGFETTESFLAEFEGHIQEGMPVIDRSSVDTSSFYE